MCTISLHYTQKYELCGLAERDLFIFDLIRANIILITSMKATGIVNRRKSTVNTRRKPWSHYNIVSKNLLVIITLL